MLAPGQGQSGAEPHPTPPHRASTSLPEQGLTPAGWFLTTLQVLILKAVNVIKMYAKRVLRIFAVSKGWPLKVNFESVSSQGTGLAGDGRCQHRARAAAAGQGGSRSRAQSVGCTRPGPAPCSTGRWPTSENSVSPSAKWEEGDSPPPRLGELMKAPHLNDLDPCFQKRGGHLHPHTECLAHSHR